MSKTILVTTIITATICFCVLFLACEQTNQNKVIVVEEESSFKEVEPINDHLLLNKFKERAVKFYSENGGTDADTYKKQLSSKECSLDLSAPSSISVSGNQFYNSFKKGVLILGKMYKCGACPDFHISASSGFVISSEGICVTNYHVFKSYDPAQPNEYETYFVMDHDGNVFPVTEILAASKHDDLAVFRIASGGKELTSLNVGLEQGVGEAVNLISHPDHRFYSYTQGHIIRKYMKPGTTKVRQCISAEFAKGSSGAPVMDDCGNVVGIVAGTQNVYYVPEWEGYQMTIREIIPVSRLRELIK